MPSPSRCAHPVSLQAKIAHLRLAASYPDHHAAVEVIETHMSFVFLTALYAYKMKKPVRYDFLDFSTLEARHADCLEELRLNRRLASSVYLDVVALCATPGGALALESAGTPVEWLVKMRRLPRHLMLDHALRNGSVSREDVRRFMRVLVDFYRNSPPAPLSPEEYRARLARDLAARARELTDPAYGLSAPAVERIAERTASFLRAHGALLDERQRNGHVVEGHGDLRPEHVCLAPEPLFIDCLEFNRELRTLDAADEVAYLALECAYAGAPDAGVAVLETYRDLSGDGVPDVLMHFYQAHRALLRAQITAWHLRDPLSDEARARWIAKARRYLALGVRHADGLDDAGSYL